MNKNYNDIMILKEQVQQQINLKVMELEQLKDQANIVYSQFCKLRELEAKIDELSDAQRYYHLRSKFDELKRKRGYDK